MLGGHIKYCPSAVDGVKSNMCPMSAGIPQGSKLGPILFIIYINNITEDLVSEILIFADDCTLIVSSDDPAQSTVILNHDLGKIKVWAAKWKITFNADKSRDIIFSKKFLNNSPPVILNNEVISRVNTHKHLGLYLTSTLDWTEHLHYVSLRAHRKLSVLRRVRNLQRSTLDLLYKITVRSIIDYGLIVFYHTLTQVQMAKLDKIQYSAAKLVTSTLHYTSKEKLFSELGWESIKERADYLGLMLFHKIHCNMTRPLTKYLMPELWTDHKI